MQIDLKSTNLDLTDSIKTYVSKKVGELERFVQNVSDSPAQDGEHETVKVFVEVGRTSHHHKKGDVYRTEINMDVPGTKHVLRAESKQHDMHLSIDDAVSDMQRQLKEYREKQTDTYRRDMRKFKKFLKISPLALYREERKKRKDQKNK